MTKVKNAFAVKNWQSFEDLIQKTERKSEVKKQLFSPEIQISIAYCDSLFEAGIFTRLEAEKVKNGLQTILKRSEFDKSYLDKFNVPNIFQFIEEKLFHLVGESGLKIQIGRGLPDRISMALRLWLREEITNISKSLSHIQSLFVDLAENNVGEIFLLQSSGKIRHPILFAHWCLAHFEVFQCDRERLDEVWRRINTMPLGSKDGVGTSLEFDREGLAKRLGFQRITTNSLEAIRNQDFMLEFINASTILAIHLSHLIEELDQKSNSDYIKLDSEIKSNYVELLQANLMKMFLYQTALNSNLQSWRLKHNEQFSGNTEALIGAVKVLKNCLKAIIFILENLSIKKAKPNEEHFLPGISDIFDYLVQRNQSVTSALESAARIEKFLMSKSKTEKVRVEDLQKFSASIENGFFDELSLKNILDSKNQIGGTSYERVLEALEDAKRVLNYEE